ncbi:MAG: hypothetical protein IPK80_07180 [Nannocystis sp.]|nr:hypothetical protein [Nannocystis sp.]
MALFYQKARDFERRAPVFNRRLEAWQADGQQLQAAMDSFNQQVQALRERTQRFNRDVQHYNSELQRARRMVDEINSMPPGPARDRKIREFRQLEGWLASESRRLDSESGQSTQRTDASLAKAPFSTSGFVSGRQKRHG